MAEHLLDLFIGRDVRPIIRLRSAPESVAREMGAQSLTLGNEQIGFVLPKSSIKIVDDY
jgi:hypothetical protein